MGEELVERVHPEERQHLGDLGVGVRKVVGHHFAFRTNGSVVTVAAISRPRRATDTGRADVEVAVQEPEADAALEHR